MHMHTITLFPSYDITTETNMSLLRTQLQAQAHAISGPERALLRVFEDDPEYSIYTQLIDICFELPRQFEIELVLLMKEPRKAMGPLSQIRQIRRIYIDAEATYGPVEQGERDHLFDTMPSFFAYGYETGVRVPADASIAADVTRRLEEHLYYLYIDGVEENVLTHVHEHYPTMQIGVQLTAVSKDTLAIIADQGGSIAYIPSTYWQQQEDSMHLPEDLLEDETVKYTFEIQGV